MSFRKYDHVERLGHLEVQGIDIGTCYIFPKLDGTNASVWLDGGEELRAGSRNRVLATGSDNAGFYSWASKQERFFALWGTKPYWRLYGEWLVPHTLKTYRDEAWRRFWVFDVFDDDAGRYVPYEEYAPILNSFAIDVIEPMTIIKNPSEAQLRAEVDKNTYLIKDGAGLGEGIVIKNYDWINRFDKQPWAKIVRNEFKEDNKRAFGLRERDGEFQVEAAIAEEFITEALVSKTRKKIELSILNDVFPDGEWAVISEEKIYFALKTHRGRLIPQLLETVFYELVNEELWGALKKYKFPTVDFKRLRQHTIVQTKRHASDLF